MCALGKNLRELHLLNFGESKARARMFNHARLFCFFLYFSCGCQELWKMLMPDGMSLSTISYEK
jgi:hypothetical protein